MQRERQAKHDSGQGWRQLGQAQMLAIVAAVIMAISIFLAIGHSPNKEAG
ncbi:MAG: hypothetical protein V5B30_07680 [Candidatus Accumulibacter delftensis]|jgi:hypothetical protein